MIETSGDSTRDGCWALVRLRIDGERIADADADGLDTDLRGLSLLEAAAVGGETLSVDALANALGPVFRAVPEAGRVAVAMSGGVDSAVALLRAGPNAVGVTLRLWTDPEGPHSERACCSPEAVLAARETCHSLGLPHITLDLREEFRRAVLIESNSGVSGVLAMIGWLASINALVLVFNLLPAFPMDGGRIVRAIAWWRTGDRASATRFAANLGRVFAYLFIGGGLLLIASGDAFGGIWLAHHGIFRRLRYANNAVMRINLLLLMAVSFLPYPTKLVADAIRDESAERTAAIFYGACLLAIALLFSALWGAVVRDRELLEPEVSDDEVNAILRAASPSIGFYAGAIALAVVAPRVAALGYLLIAFVGVLRARGDETVAEPA